MEVQLPMNVGELARQSVFKRARPLSGRPGALLALAFSPNPGGLVAKRFVPSDLPPGAPLVVVLHGCTQTPEGYDEGTGWSRLAQKHGFAVLYPEQQRANNPNGCFNWFEPADMKRDAGEAASIKSMIDRMVIDHAIDPKRVFITGLSAGAAMAGVMLASYPEVFAGGGLIAGLPYGVARSMPAALSRMRSRGRESDAQLGGLVRQASAHDGPWPSISIWHGTADTTVAAANADATVAQWCAVHGLDKMTVVEDIERGHLHRIWHDRSGRACVEQYVIGGMGHGTPLDAASVNNSETAGAYLLDVGLSSTQILASSWRLIGDVDDNESEQVAMTGEPRTPFARLREAPAFATAGIDVQAIIEKALRSAGLMR